MGASDVTPENAAGQQKCQHRLGRRLTVQVNACGKAGFHGRGLHVQFAASERGKLACLGA